MLPCVKTGRRYVCINVDWTEDGPGTESNRVRGDRWGMGVRKPIFYSRLIGPVSWARWALPWSPAGPQPLGAGCPSAWRVSQRGRAYVGTTWNHTAEHLWPHQSWVPPSTPVINKKRQYRICWWVWSCHITMVCKSLKNFSHLTQWLTKFLTRTAGAKDLAGFIPAPV